MYNINKYNANDLAHARVIQAELQKKIRVCENNIIPETIAGADISFNRFSDIAYSCIAILDFNTLKPIRISLAKGKLNFPYIPGYLSFREIPILLNAWNQIDIKPDILIIDGHGVSHPKQMGIATHFGIIVNQTTIGCAKNKLCGTYTEPNILKGSLSYLEYKQLILGAVLRSKTNIKPIFVSPGNNINLESSITITRQCITRYRLPEPTRLAHKFVNLFRIGELKEGLIDM